jgi:hypothetical protein
MARIRFILVAAAAIALAGCPLIEQQENLISFTWDGMQYLFTASAGPADHPHAEAYAWEGGDPYEYVIRGSATTADALAGTNTIIIQIGNDGDWHVSAYLYEDDPQYPTSLYLGQIPEEWIDALIANRDAVGEQFAGSMPGPFQGETPVLENVVFSVERLPNQEPPQVE